MSAYERLSEVSSSSSHADIINLNDNIRAGMEAAAAANAVQEAAEAEDLDFDGNVNEDNDNELSPIPSPTVSIRHLEGRNVQDNAVPRPWWLSPMVVLDFVVFIAISASKKAQHAVMAEKHRVGLDDAEKQTFTSVIIAMCQFSQLLMGMMMIPALCRRNDALLIASYRIYLIGSCFCFVMLGFVVISTIAITSKTETYGYDRWQRIEGYLMNMLLRFVDSILVHRQLKKHNATVTAQVSYEQWFPTRNFRRRRRHQPAPPQIPLVFAKEDPAEEADVDPIDGDVMFK